jgi:hypothetical protein
MPKSTPIAQIPNSIIDATEDDETVREVLRELSVANEHTNAKSTPSSPQEEDYQRQSPADVYTHNHNDVPTHAPPPPSAAMSANRGQIQEPFAPSPDVALIPPTRFPNRLVYEATSDEDIRTALVVSGLCILVQCVPVENIVKKYISSLNGFSYADILIKSVVAGVIFYLMRRYGVPFNI